MKKVLAIIAALSLAVPSFGAVDVVLGRLSDLTWTAGADNNRVALWGSSFSPLSVSGLSFWIDVSNANTLTLDSTAISQVDDLSGRDKHAVQTSAASKPTLVSDAQNGLAVAQFDGSEDWLYVTGANAGYTVDVFVVMKIMTFSNAGLFLSSPENGYMTGSYKLSGAVENEINVINSDGTHLANIPFSGAAFHALRICFARDGTNDSSQISSDINVAYFSYSDRVFATSLANLDIGRFNAPGHYQNCQIGEMLIFSNKVSDADALQINSYLTDKWGL